MPSPYDSGEVAAARTALGRQLASLRRAAGISQVTFAPRTGYGRSTLANVETGRQNAPRQFWQRCADQLSAPELVTSYDQIEEMVAARRREEATRMQARREAAISKWRQAATDAAAGDRAPHAAEIPVSRETAVMTAPDSAGLPADAASYMLHARWPGARQSRSLSGHGVDWHVELPTGRVLDGGGRVAVQTHQMMKTSDGRCFLPAGDDRVRQLLLTRQRAMLVGVTQGESGTSSVRVMDLSHARKRVTGGNPADSALLMPPECELDDLSYAIIWAVTGLDDALQADDSVLDRYFREFSPYETQPRSALPSHAVPELTAAARMWLGSTFCARHILRNLGRPDDQSAFWTREQTGEEACVWLLFRHKYDYLRHLSGMTGEPAIRGFCIPEATVLCSPRWERILLFLAIALMEAMGIRVTICTEPEYGTVDGFVLMPRTKAIIATWVRAEGIWDAGTTSNTTALQTFAEVTGHAGAHSVIESAAPAGRLRKLADYLCLDWTWLTRRGEGLGAGGCARLVQPRSRLLSLDGVDTALRFVGAMGHQDSRAGTR